MNHETVRQCASCGRARVALHPDTHPETGGAYPETVQMLCDTCDAVISLLLSYPPQARRNVIDWIASEKFPDKYPGEV